MEYYCKRYRFPKPDIEFSQVAQKSKKGAKKGGVTSWEAVIAVGGRKIGVGSANNKKAAQIRCYLDVTQYLESCDPDLWQDFIHAMPSTDTPDRMAPHLVFQMSDSLNEDIQGLCADIRNSTLHRNAPPANVASEEQTMPTWTGARLARLSMEEHGVKSQYLQDKLQKYRTQPEHKRMRDSRQALPVTSRAQSILDQIDANDVTIIMAATGSGKTTQIPQIILDSYIDKGQGSKCNILCTQPRRLAATSVAERIADERGDRLGGEVGYQVRFDTKLPQPNGSITFCTTGIFLKRMQSSLGVGANPTSVGVMDQITHIVVDEVHERDIDTDLSLVVLKRLLADRKARGIPLKVILMSATIDPTLFQNYFKNDAGIPAPVAEVPGRTFPVEKHWLNETVAELRRNPTASWVFNDRNVADYLARELTPNPELFGPDTGMDLEIPYPLVALYIAHVLKQSDDGHVLVFLPGWDEIRKVAAIMMEGRNLLDVNFQDESKYSIHYLHSTIPAAEQRQVFTPPPKGVRRIILATNIAETSITIPDVVYVVDAGRVKEIRYDPERHMSSLVSAWVGSSNLNQRAGRAGRHREGLYYGLVSHNRYNSLNTHQTVEMKRSDLSNVVMHVKVRELDYMHREDFADRTGFGNGRDRGCPGRHHRTT
jgi:small subunit ribosomal protein S24e